MSGRTGWSLAALALGALVAGTAVAGTPRLDHREHNQRQRIEQGVDVGRVALEETRRLVKGQMHLRRMEAKAKSDGVVTRRERARIHHAQNVESRRIHRQKHDAQHR